MPWLLERSKLMLDLISRRVIISVLAEELAEKQKRADYWFYIRKNQEMSSYVLHHVEEIKRITIKLGISKEVYDAAYRIYDFRNSGKKNYVPDLNELSKWCFVKGV